MGKNLTDQHDSLRLRRSEGRFIDWEEYTTGGLFTTTADGSATAAVGNGAGGVLTLSAIDSTLNRQVYVATTNSFFSLTGSGTLGLNKPLIAECYLQWTEANTNKANVGFGFMSAVGTGALADTTGEPKSSFSGAVIYKVPGGTNWKTCSSVGTTQNVSQSDTAAGNSATYTRLRIEISPLSATLAEVTYYVDGVQLKTAGGRPGTALIKDQLTITSAAAMQLFHGLKNGSTTPEALSVDYTAWEFNCRPSAP